MTEREPEEIKFDGEQPGVKIPGGLREPDPGRQVPEGQYIEGYGSLESESTEQRSPERVGADKDIEFGGEQPGVNVPGGLREPGESPEKSR